jgi:hypothetical protein
MRGEYEKPIDGGIWWSHYSAGASVTMKTLDCLQPQLR